MDKFKLKWILLVLAISVKSSEGNGMLYPTESESREVKDISGIWKFRHDSKNEGFTQQWFKGIPEPTIQMPVPASYNDVTQEASIRDAIGWVWYETSFRVPARWTTDRVVLRFGAAHYYAAAYLNGKSIVQHSGGHLPFEADVSDTLSFNTTNLLVVAVNNILNETTLPPGKITVYNNNAWYPNGYTTQSTFFDFFNYAGIDRPVKLYTTPTTYIDDFTIDYSIAGNGDGVVSYEVSVLPSVPSSFKVNLIDKGKVIASNSTVSGTLTVPKAVLHLWEPSSPYLYTLEIISGTKGTSNYDVYRFEYVGIRTIQVTSTQFLLNGKPFYFHGVDMHEDANVRGKGYDTVLLVKDFNLLEWLHVNAIRTSHYPYTEEFYMEACKRGIAIIDEATAVGLAKAEFFNAQTLQQHKDVMFEMVRRDKNFPAVVMWSIANEPASNLAPAVNYFQEVARYTRSIDTTHRPLTIIESVDFTGETCAQFVDVIGVNRYYAWYTDSGRTELINRQLSYDLDQWFGKYAKPIIVSEYGADTLSLHEDPAVMFTEEYQTDFMGKYQEVFDQKKLYLVGELVWNFADFRTGQGIIRVQSMNFKGIFSRDRKPKPAAFQLKARYEHLSSTLKKHSIAL